MLTPEQKAEVIAEYRRVRSPYKVANNLGFDVKDVWEVIDENPDAAVQNVERWGGEGRPDLRPFFVASSRCADRWDNEEPGVALARERFCAGTHTMATHRDGSVKFLCSIPLRKKVAAQPDYFRPEVQL
ncbi:hypothetical protein [Sphingomonas jaspsi]|uniref:hypothetical protein n=1 Tax=Sphingomonas jaspsi TaxID=392409 RepID=UPI0004AC9C22|nr:hypothetical protein [Sphingomonas jaspsi]